MKHDGVGQIFGAGVFFLLLVATFGSMGLPLERNNPQPLGILNFDPKSHDFGNMSQGETNSTVFDIWTSGGCCELIFNLTWNCAWVSAFPTSGVSNGEHVPITVTVNTTGLSIGLYTCGILITTNDCGEGVFNVTVNIVSTDHPSLAFNPQTCYFGIIPENHILSTSFEIWNGGNGTLDYALSCDDNWVAVSPMKGSSMGEHDRVTVTIDTKGLMNETTYQCYIPIESNGGNEAFGVSVTIGTIPKFEITSISGGLFHIKTVIKNNGTADATGVDWQIIVGGNGLVLLGAKTTGTFSALPVGTEQTISSRFILGLGDVKVTLIIQSTDAMPVVETTSARLFLSYIRI
jgi:hypothetical protein